MKKILYGTTNRAKVKHMREMLHGMGIDIIGLNEICELPPKVTEDGKTPLENARKKAERYFSEFEIPVFSCDSGLYLEGIEMEEQPGVNVRRVKGKELSDQEMIEHYSDLARRRGGEVVGWYENAICLKVDKDSYFEYQGPEIASEKFIISKNPCDKRLKGFPLDSLSKNIVTKKYFLEETKEGDQGDHMREGVRRFFKESLKHAL